MDNIEKIKKILKDFENNSIKDYDFWAWQINSLFTGLEPAKYYLIDENGKTLEDVINEVNKVGLINVASYNEIKEVIEKVNMK